MTLTKYDGVAILPKRCDRCNRLFWLEPYNIFYKFVGIEEYPLKQIECKNCICKAESDHKCHTCKHYMSGEYDGSCDSYICEHYSGWESEDKK